MKTIPVDINDLPDGRQFTTQEEVIRSLGYTPSVIYKAETTNHTIYVAMETHEPIRESTENLQASE